MPHFDEPTHATPRLRLVAGTPVRARVTGQGIMRGTGGQAYFSPARIAQAMRSQGIPADTVAQIVGELMADAYAAEVV